MLIVCHAITAAMNSSRIQVHLGTGTRFCWKKSPYQESVEYLYNTLFNPEEISADRTQAKGSPKSGGMTGWVARSCRDIQVLSIWSPAGNGLVRT